MKQSRIVWFVGLAVVATVGVWVMFARHAPSPAPVSRVARSGVDAGTIASPLATDPSASPEAMRGDTPSKVDTPSADAGEGETRGGVAADEEEGERRVAFEAALEGLDVAPAGPEVLAAMKVPNGQSGVVIGGVSPTSAAAEAHLRKDDVIVFAHGEQISDVDSLRAAVSKREHNLLTVYRGGRPFKIMLHAPLPK